MSVAERRRQGGSTTVDSSLGNLSLSQSSPASKSSSKAPANVADSWEDESSASEPTTPVAEPPPSALHPQPQAPPPTPASPSASFDNPYALPAEFPSPSARPRGDRSGADDGKRPEKTTSTASRMIAGALGVKAPRKREEMRAYEKAAADKEKARRDRERSEREEEEQRKKSVWED